MILKGAINVDCIVAALGIYTSTDFTVDWNDGGDLS